MVVVGDHQRLTVIKKPPGQGQRILSLPKTAARYDVHPRTINRWIEDEKLAFPQPILIHNRKYFLIDELARWEQTQIRGMVDIKHGIAAPGQAGADARVGISDLRSKTAASGKEGPQGRAPHRQALTLTATENSRPGRSQGLEKPRPAGARTPPV